MSHPAAPMIPTHRRTITMPMETVPAVTLLLPPDDFGFSAEWFPELYLLASASGTGDEGGVREGFAPLNDGGGGDHCITGAGVDEFEGKSEDGELLGDDAAGKGGESLGGTEAGEGGEFSDGLDAGDGGEPPSAGELEEGGEGGEDDDPF